jgi:NAD(P)-dependent dehydrogenase (short-subunit alcohol dehydrogenase family)
MRFKEKVVLVTGAGRGLGRAFAEAFGAEGAKVVLAGRTFSKVENAAMGIIENGGQALPILCEVSEHDSVKACVKAAVQKFGPVDVMVNNAAYQQTRPVLEVSADEFDRQMKINMYGTFYFIKEVLPSMVERRYGKIINISSAAAKHFFPGFAAYAASKAAIAGFSNVLSEEVKEYGVNVNTLFLGLTRTEAVTCRIGIDPNVNVPLERMMLPEEVAKVVMFIASEAGKPFVGAGLDVNGLQI